MLQVVSHAEVSLHIPSAFPHSPHLPPHTHTHQNTHQHKQMVSTWTTPPRVYRTRSEEQYTLRHVS